MAVQDPNTLPTQDLFERTVALARTEPILESDAYWAHVRALHVRSGRDAYVEAVRLCSNADPVSRAAGAAVLAQLGARMGGQTAEYPYADESAPVLMSLLGDGDSRVVASALYALGHLSRGEPEQLARLAGHPAEDVRCALAYAFCCRHDRISIEALIALSADEDLETRDWATFALGSQSDEDSPAIRAALAARLADRDDEVRGEAIVGLAQRMDERAFLPLLRELTERGVMNLAIEAAAAMPRSEFLPHLESLHRANPDDELILKALTACREVSQKA